VKLSALLALLLSFSSGCTPLVYAPPHQPWDLLFQKKVYGGGVTVWVGDELNAPTFSLYANGVAVYVQHIGGKRKLVYSRLDQKDFDIFYDRIQRVLFAVKEDSLAQKEVKENEDLKTAPTIEFFIGGTNLKIQGLGFYRTTYDSLQQFNRWLDQMSWNNFKQFYADSVRLYVKKTPGDSKAWPPWRIEAIDLKSIYKKEVSFYEPNVEENALTVGGILARKIQDEIDQTGIYQKFSFKSEILGVGYKPLLP